MSRLAMCFFALTAFLLLFGCISPGLQRPTITPSPTFSVAPNYSSENLSDFAAGLGDRVSINYVMAVNETVLDTNVRKIAEEAGIYSESRLYEPLVFIVGAQGMLPGLDVGVRGMKIGETRILKPPSELTYGDYREDLVIAVPIGEFLASNMTPYVGMGIKREFNGTEAIGKVVRVENETVWVDTNHPLAGKNVEFMITLVDVQRLKMSTE